MGGFRFVPGKGSGVPSPLAFPLSRGLEGEHGPILGQQPRNDSFKTEGTCGLDAKKHQPGMVSVLLAVRRMFRLVLFGVSALEAKPIS